MERLFKKKNQRELNFVKSMFETLHNSSVAIVCLYVISQKIFSSVDYYPDAVEICIFFR